MDRASRKSCRAQVTKIIICAKDKLANVNELINEFVVPRDRLIKASESLQIANEKVALQLKEEEYEEECERVTEYDDQVTETLSRLRIRIEGIGAEEEEFDDDAASQLSRHSTRTQRSQQYRRSQVSTMHSNTDTNNVRLPKLELRKFEGQLSDWTLFWEQFRTTVHENESLDAVAKFNYLERVLVGKAASTISGLTPSKTAYKDAIELLQHEYGNQQRIIDNHIQNLLALTPIKARMDAIVLRQLYNAASSITRNLNSLGVNPVEYGMMVKSVVLNCMPYAMKVDYHKRHTADDPNSASKPDIATQINSLLQYLKIEVESIEIAQTQTSNSKDKPNADKGKAPPKFGIQTSKTNKESNNQEFTAAGLLATVNECLFCKAKNHIVEECANTNVTLDQKKEILKRERRCYRCTRPNHNSKKCKTSIACSKCKRKHATSMCDPEFRNRTPNQTNETSTNAIANLFAHSEENQDQIFLQTAKAYVAASNSSQNTFIRLILDGGSQLTYIKEDLSRKLGLKKIGTRKLSVMPFGSSQRTCPKIYNKVELKLISQFGNETILVQAIEVPEICFDSFVTPNTASFPALQHLNIADLSKENIPVINGIVLLVGADNYWKIATGEIIHLTEDLAAINTKLGWTIQGVYLNRNATVAANTVTALLTSYEDNEVDLKRMWDLETLGINDKSCDNLSTQQFIENQISIKNNRFEITLPWKNTCNIDNYYQGALSRMNSLVYRLSKNSRFFEYDQAVRELINSGVAELVPPDTDPAKTYYMPHRPVYREDKSTSKVRVVFDASAHAPGFPSLNELLRVGENLIKDLMKILLNFRVGEIGITADIEKAFLQIALHPDDRDSHRFLWFKYPITDPKRLPPLQEYRMTRVTFGVTSSPFLLAATLSKLFEMKSLQFPEITARLMRSFYVDDLILTANSLQNAKHLYHGAKQILQQCQMNLRKWHTNDTQYRKYLDENECEHEPSIKHKVLGLKWDVIDDTLGVDLSSVTSFVQENTNCTKRCILQAIGRIYDPLSLLAPFTIRAKILLQSIWKLKADWDSLLSAEFHVPWSRWCQDLLKLSDYKVSRNVLPSSCDCVELHIFADASQMAYGAVAYIRCMKDDEISVKLLLAKGRVAPIKNCGSSEFTLPKLELTAALCSSRLKQYIVSNVDIHFASIHLWTDSQITLYWITGNVAKWKPYVKNRVTEIQALTKDCVWKHCAGELNPADLLTRGVRADALLKSRSWLSGPQFLSTKDSEWPMPTEIIPLNAVLCVVPRNETPIESNELKSIFPINTYQSLEKCLRVTCYVKRVYSKSKCSSSVITPEELDNAQLYWIKIEQASAYGEEIAQLKKHNSINQNSSIVKLMPFLDDSGVLRIRSRLQESELPFATNNPILLPKKSLLVEKLIWKTHNKWYHRGVNFVLAQLRKQFWIVQGRQVIKSLLSKCLICKRFRGKPGRDLFAPLPKDRISMSCPFERTGVDFAGPLYVIDENNQKRKTYLMLLTCAVTRAVHLELVLDLTTESCIRAFRRFIARRGVSSTIYSDNAKTFKRASIEINALYEALTNDKMLNFLSSQRISWKFSIERGAWWGGFWERMIKTVKGCLKFALGKSMVSIDELNTILIEIEATVNSRPLTYIEEDKDSLSILSPSNFLLSNQRRCGLPDAPQSRDIIIKQWKERKRIVSKFWKKWSEDYLQQLRTAHVNVKGPISNSFKINDIVLVHDQHVPRLAWKMAKISQVYSGRDNKIRACEVQLANKTLLRRPIQLLYPLELDPQNSNGAREDVENVNTKPEMALVVTNETTDVTGAGNAGS